jgi:hypothetical protein
MGILSAIPPISQGHGPDAAEQASQVLEALATAPPASGAFRGTEAAACPSTLTLCRSPGRAVANSGGLVPEPDPTIVADRAPPPRQSALIALDLGAGRTGHQ